MSAARVLLRASGNAVLASTLAGAGFALVRALAGGIDASSGLARSVPIAAVEHSLALAPIALAITLGGSLALVELARLRRARRVLAGALGGAALGAFALFHDAITEALQRALPPLGNALARASAFVTTQPKVAVIACVAFATAYAISGFLARRARSEQVIGSLVPLALFALAAIGLHVARARLPAPNAKSVLLVVLDTVSARHLASGGYGRNTMPELEALAARGVRFPNAYSAAPWTVPSHASMFTGQAPIAHGATQENVVLEESRNTLAEILRNEGFHTFAAAGNTVVGPYSQLDQGFARFLPTWRRDVLAATRGVSAHPNNVVLARFLASVPRSQHFFAFVNYIDAHAPYAPPPPDDRRFGAFPRREVDPSWQHYYTGRSALGSLDFQELADLYDGELAKLSRDLAGLIASLEAAGRLDDTLVIVTSDHGENLGDHAHLDHVFNLYDSVLHVPLLLIGAGVPAGVVDQRPATSVDVFATALLAAGVDPAPFRTEGRDLLAPPVARGELTHEYYFPNQALSAIDPADLASAQGRLKRYLRRLRSLRSQDGWKLIWSSDGRHELYHVANDPNERDDLAAREPARVAEMVHRLEQRLAEQNGTFRFADEAAPVASGGFESLDDETRKNLESLGYVK